MYFEIAAWILLWFICGVGLQWLGTCLLQRTQRFSASFALSTAVVLLLWIVKPDLFHFVAQLHQ